MTSATPTTRYPLHECRCGLGVLRDAMADVCTVEVPNREDCRAQTRAVCLRSAVLTEVRTSSLSFLRSSRHVARSGYDHYQLNLNLAGMTHIYSERRSAVIRPGDIGIVDTMRAADTHVQAAEDSTSHCIAIFIPRGMLAPLFSSPDGGHCTVLRGDTGSGRLLRDHIVSLVQSAEELTEAQIGDSMNGLLGLLASGVGVVDTTLPLRQATRQSVLASLKRYIEGRLDEPAISTASICKRFGLSRATLYRLFENDSGLINYIQQRRLQRAFSLLMSTARPTPRILDIALDNHFASDATFNRAFRRAYGVPPGELRNLASTRRTAERHEFAGRASEAQLQPVRWIQNLKPPMMRDATARQQPRQ